MVAPGIQWHGAIFTTFFPPYMWSCNLHITPFITGSGAQLVAKVNFFVGVNTLPIQFVFVELGLLTKSKDVMMSECPRFVFFGGDMGYSDFETHPRLAKCIFLIYIYINVKNMLLQTCVLYEVSFFLSPLELPKSRLRAETSTAVKERTLPSMNYWSVHIGINVMVY